MNRIKKIAIVHDDFIQSGGAEKIASAFLEIFPNADLYTSIITKPWKAELTCKHPNLKIRSSFISHIPFASKFYKLLALLYPLVFYVFDFGKYDLVISSSSRFAHGVRTSGKTVHIAYIHSPARMVWEPRQYFGQPFLTIIFPLLVILRVWDRFASTLPHVLIANSKLTQSRIKKYWSRSSEIIYPFFDLNVRGLKPEVTEESSGYYLIVSRLERWKQIEIAVEACNKLKKKLVIVGEGKYESTLKKLADPVYVNFTGRLSDQDLVNIYLGSRALIVTQKEDFGITAVEAQSFGVPVIAYKSGGSTETVLSNQTGVFFDNQTPSDLASAINKFEKIVIDPELCIIQANKFDKSIFVRRILDKLEAL